MEDNIIISFLIFTNIITLVLLLIILTDYHIERVDSKWKYNYIKKEYKKLFDKYER